MTRAYNTATTQQNSGGAVAGVTAGKNPVLNSAFNVWQRGTSFTATSGYTADRWYVNHAVAGRTVTRQVTNDTTNLPFIQYCLRYQRDSGNTTANNSILYQSFESINSIPYAGKTVTMSFYARAGANFSAASGRLGVYLISGTGTDQNYGNGYTGAAYPINNGTATLTTTWQRFTFTGTVGATATELTAYFETGTVGTAGAADYFEITGVQLEVGSVATPYAPYSATYQGELAACQRYYWRSNNNGAAYAVIGTAMGVSSTTGRVFIQTPVPLRAGAISIEYSNLLELSFYTPGASVVNGATSITLYGSYSGISMVTISFIFPSGLTSNAMYVLACNGTTNAYLAISSEL